ncbi:MAG: squalene synthase HpnC [Bacteroidetes bacterium]|nr:squalene synthase HpnC [Bacteroidota bacterium]
MLKDYDSAYEYCRKIALNHYENFPVGSFLIPEDKRKYFYSVYAFSRFADDIADSVEYDEENKLRKLEQLETELDKLESGRAEEFAENTADIFTALSDTVSNLNIPVHEFRDLLSAFKQDSVKRDYGNFKELIEYSQRSANPIGHLVLYIFGYDKKTNRKLFRDSDRICTALQLTNFWQDVSEDLKIDRIYIPGNSMSEFNYNTDKLKNKIENDDFRNMIRDLAGKTEKLFDDGSGIVSELKGRLRLEIKATIYGGREILSKIRKINYNVLSERVKLNTKDKIKILIKSLIK